MICRRAALLPALFLLLFLSGCASVGPSDEIQKVIEVAISSVQSTEPFQILAASELPADVRRSILSMPQAAPRDAVTASAEYSLLPGYMKITAISINGDEAHFVGILGPLPSPERRHVDCGMTYSIELRRRDLAWVIVKATVAEC
jgi:predicted component of type VI protein secretion system